MRLLMRHTDNTFHYSRNVFQTLVRIGRGTFILLLGIYPRQEIHIIMQFPPFHDHTV